MKKKEILSNIIIVFLVIAIILVILMKFVFTDNAHHSFSISNIQDIIVFDLDNNQVRYADLLSGAGTHYCMIFDMRDCPSCIVKGLDDLMQLQKEGKRPIILGVFNSIEELRGWANANECQDIFLLKKITFYNNFHCETTPVIVRFKKFIPETFRYIIP